MLKGVPEIYVMLLANVTLVNLIYKKKMSHNEKDDLPLDECMKFGGQDKGEHKASVHHFSANCQCITFAL